MRPPPFSLLRPSWLGALVLAVVAQAVPAHANVVVTLHLPDNLVAGIAPIPLLVTVTGAPDEKVRWFVAKGRPVKDGRGMCFEDPEGHWFYQPHEKRDTFEEVTLTAVSRSDPEASATGLLVLQPTLEVFNVINQVNNQDSSQIYFPDTKSDAPAVPAGSATGSSSSAAASSSGSAAAAPHKRKGEVKASEEEKEASPSKRRRTDVGPRVSAVQPTWMKAAGVYSDQAAHGGLESDSVPKNQKRGFFSSYQHGFFSPRPWLADSVPIVGYNTVTNLKWPRPDFKVVSQEVTVNSGGTNETHNSGGRNEMNLRPRHFARINQDLEFLAGTPGLGGVRPGSGRIHPRRPGLGLPPR